MCQSTKKLLKQDLRRESNAALAKTHAQLHRRQQLARKLEAVRAAKEERAALSAPQSRRGAHRCDD